MVEVKFHPTYDMYCCTSEGDIISKTGKVIGNRNPDTGYIAFGISQGDDKITKLAHRFVWECFFGEIPVGHEIDHINRQRTDNRIKNLQCISLNNNRKKAYMVREDKNWGSQAHKMARSIKAIEENGEIKYFKNKSQCAKYYDISPAMIYLIIEKQNRVKLANTNRGKCNFEYAEDGEYDYQVVLRKKKNT